VVLVVVVGVVVVVVPIRYSLVARE
jgi:hypothetical protein